MYLANLEIACCHFLNRKWNWRCNDQSLLLSFHVTSNWCGQQCDSEVNGMPCQFFIRRNRVNYSETVGIKGISLSTIRGYLLRRVYGLVQLAVKLIAMSYQYRISLPLSFLKMKKKQKTINMLFLTNPRLAL